MEEKKVMPADNNEERITTNEVDNCISSDAENSEKMVEKITRIKVKKFFKNIFVLIVIAIAIFCALLALDKYKNVFEGKVINLISFKKDNDVDSKEYSDEEKAVKVARAKFKELGENVDDTELEVLKITRKGNYYYFISSKENTVEISADTFEVKRINSVPVEEYTKW